MKKKRFINPLTRRYVPVSVLINILWLGRLVASHVRMFPVESLESADDGATGEAVGEQQHALLEDVS